MDTSRVGEQVYFKGYMKLLIGNGQDILHQCQSDFSWNRAMSDRLNIRNHGDKVG